MDDAEREALMSIAAAQEADVIDRALTAARERLRMDAAYLSDIDLRRQRVHDVSGDAAALGIGVGTEIPLDRAYCTLMLKGELPSLVPDTSAEPAVRDLPATRLLGSYAGVAVTLPDGRLHGTLEPRAASRASTSARRNSPFCASWPTWWRRGSSAPKRSGRTSAGRAQRGGSGLPALRLRASFARRRRRRLRVVAADARPGPGARRALRAA